MVAKIAETNFSYNRYLQGLLCKLYWRTIHGSWWKPIEGSNWTKTVKEPEQSTRKIASIFCSWRWKSGTRERRATLLFGPSTLKTEIKSAVLSIFQPHLAVLHLDHEGGLVRFRGLDEHHQVAVEGAAWDLQLLQIILLGGELVSFSQEQEICQVFLLTPLHQATCVNDLYLRLFEQEECRRVGWTGHWSNPRLQKHLQVKTHLREGRIPAQCLDQGKYDHLFRIQMQSARTLWEAKKGDFLLTFSYKGGWHDSAKIVL